MARVELSVVRQFAEEYDYDDATPIFEPEIERARHQRNPQVGKVYDLENESISQIANNRKLFANKSRANVVRVCILGLTIIAFAAIYLMREERVAAASAEVSKISREIESLFVTLDEKKTAFECSTDLERIREVASTKLGMNYPSEDQINYIDYENTDTSAGPVVYTPILINLQNESSGAAYNKTYGQVAGVVTPEEVTIEVDYPSEDTPETTAENLDIENGSFEELGPEQGENGDVFIPSE